MGKHRPSQSQLPRSARDLAKLCFHSEVTHSPSPSRNQSPPRSASLKVGQAGSGARAMASKGGVSGQARGDEVRSEPEASDATEGSSNSPHRVEERDALWEGQALPHLLHKHVAVDHRHRPTPPSVPHRIPLRSPLHLRPRLRLRLRIRLRICPPSLRALPRRSPFVPLPDLLACPLEIPGSR